MKFPFLRHPRTGLPDVLATMTVVVVLASAIKFLLDGVSVVISGHTIMFGHTDPMTYGTLLTPVLGSHSYLNSRNNTVNTLAGADVTPDNPDV